MTVTQILRSLVFFDHGTRLLTPQTAFWLVSMWVLALFLSVAEGFAWNRALATALPPELGHWALAIGLAWAVCVFLLDASFTKLDLDVSKINGPAQGKADAEEPASSGLKRLLHSKVAWSATVRTAVLVLSAVVTSQMLASTFEEKKAIQEIGTRNTALIAEARKAEIDKAGARVIRLEAEKTELDKAYAQEVQGLTGGRRGGEGPVARGIKAAIALKQTELDQARTERDTADTAINGMGDDEFASHYGIKKLPDNPDTRRLVLKDLEATQPPVMIFKVIPATEAMSVVFFILIFAGILIMKILQPQSVTLYYSETSQALYYRYLAGEFDACLPPVYHPKGPTPLNAITFAQMLESHILPWLADRAAHQESELLRSRIKAEMVTTEEKRPALEATLAARKGELEVCQLAAESAAQALAEHRVQIEQVTADKDRLHATVCDVIQRAKERELNTIDLDLRTGYDRHDAICERLEQLKDERDTVVEQIARPLRRADKLPWAFPDPNCVTDPDLASALNRRLSLNDEDKRLGDEAAELGRLINKWLKDRDVLQRQGIDELGASGVGRFASEADAPRKKLETAERDLQNLHANTQQIEAAEVETDGALSRAKAAFKEAQDELRALEARLKGLRAQLHPAVVVQSD